MTASVEWLCPCLTVGLVRVHANGDGLGDPYTWAVAFVRDTDELDVAILVGVTRTPSLSETRAGMQALKAAGFRRVCWERRRENGAVEDRHGLRLPS